MAVANPLRRARRLSLSCVAVTMVAAISATVAPLSPATARPAPVAAAPPGPALPADGPACSSKVFAAPVQVAAAHARTPRKFAEAAARVSEGVHLDEMVTDPTAWFDSCGEVFYVEPRATDEEIADAQAASAAAAAAAAASPDTGQGPVAAFADTFALESLPGSDRTIYLDFDGGVVTGTAWNQSYGADPIIVTPYDDDGSVDTSFSTKELADIQDTWASVAADYEPFDVNVTTAWPGQDAITRSSANDPTYGSHVMITNDGPIYDRCFCAGVAYIDVFDTHWSHAAYQPAWVFANGSGHSGKGIGEAAAHEVGHNFGLGHDGTASYAYYAGATPWAPIMGAGYYQPVSQWSQGEYASASNTEDDLAIIAAMAPLRADDHGDTRLTATAVSVGESVAGTIESRTDLDAFTFTGAGHSTVAVELPPFTNLDTELVVRNEAHAIVARMNPQVARADARTATGMDVTWSGVLPSEGATWSFTVDGAGNTGTGTAYSDYGSVGAYTVTVTTGDSEPDPVSATGTTPVPATRTQPYAGQFPVRATGGTAPFTYAATGLPAGISMQAGTGELVGTPTVAGTYPVSVTVTDATAATASAEFDLVVRHPAVASTDQAFTARVGDGFAGQLDATRGDGGTYTWTTPADTPRPAWLNLSTSGRLSGTPDVAEPVSFDAVVASGGTTARVTVTVDVADAPVEPVVVERRELTAFTGRTLDERLGATGGDGTYTWQVVGGALPPGVTLTQDGRISGAPTSPGRWTPRVRATSGPASHPSSGTARVVLTVHPPLVFTTRARLPRAVQGRRFRTVIRTDGAYGVVTWTKVGGLPPGLRHATRADRIVIKGRGKTRTKQKVTFRGVDEAGRRLRRTFVVRVVR